MVTDAAAVRRRRMLLAALAVVTIAAGLVVHTMLDGVIGDIAGDALYAALIYLLAAFAMPARSWPRPALTAAAVCAAVELLQLTDVPRALGAWFPPAALVLGTGFDARDLVVYAAAIAVVASADAAVLRLGARSAVGRGTGDDLRTR